MLSFTQQNWQLALVSPRNTQGRPPENLNLIVDRLYLGNWTAASNEEQLTELGITHVVSALEISPDIPDVIKTENKLHIPIHDNSSVDILKHFEQTTAFIRSALEADENNKVLVHCLMGVSRSATVVAAYLIATATEKMYGADAIAFLQSKRPTVCPNLGFRQQLDMYATRQRKEKHKHKPSEHRPSTLRKLKAWTNAFRFTGRASDAVASSSSSLP